MYIEDTDKPTMSDDELSNFAKFVFNQPSNGNSSPIGKDIIKYIDNGDDTTTKIVYEYQNLDKERDENNMADDFSRYKFNTNAKLNFDPQPQVQQQPVQQQSYEQYNNYTQPVQQYNYNQQYYTGYGYNQPIQQYNQYGYNQPMQQYNQYGYNQPMQQQYYTGYGYNQPVMQQNPYGYYQINPYNNQPIFLEYTSTPYVPVENNNKTTYITDKSSGETFKTNFKTAGEPYQPTTNTQSFYGRSMFGAQPTEGPTPFNDYNLAYSNIYNSKAMREYAISQSNIYKLMSRALHKARGTEISEERLSELYDPSFIRNQKIQEREFKKRQEAILNYQKGIPSQPQKTPEEKRLEYLNYNSFNVLPYLKANTMMYKNMVIQELHKVHNHHASIIPPDCTAREFELNSYKLFEDIANEKRRKKLNNLGALSNPILNLKYLLHIADKKKKEGTYHPYIQGFEDYAKEKIEQADSSELVLKNLSDALLSAEKNPMLTPVEELNNYRETINNLGLRDNVRENYLERKARFYQSIQG